MCMCRMDAQPRGCQLTIMLFWEAYAHEKASRRDGHWGPTMTGLPHARMRQPVQAVPKRHPAICDAAASWAA